MARTASFVTEHARHGSNSYVNSAELLQIQKLQGLEQVVCINYTDALLSPPGGRRSLERAAIFAGGNGEQVESWVGHPPEAESVVLLSRQRLFGYQNGDGRAILELKDAVYGWLGHGATMPISASAIEDTKLSRIPGLRAVDMVIAERKPCLEASASHWLVFLQLKQGVDITQAEAELQNIFTEWRGPGGWIPGLVPAVSKLAPNALRIMRLLYWSAAMVFVGSLMSLFVLSVLFGLYRAKDGQLYAMLGASAFNQFVIENISTISMHTFGAWIGAMWVEFRVRSYLQGGISGFAVLGGQEAENILQVATISLLATFFMIAAGWMVVVIVSRHNTQSVSQKWSWIGVGAQVAVAMLSISLVLGTALYIRDLKKQELGFNPENLWLIQTKADDENTLYSFMTGLRQESGIETLGACDYVPLIGASGGFDLVALSDRQPQTPTLWQARHMSWGYLEAIGGQVLAGRHLEETTPRTVVTISKTAAVYFWGSPDDAIGNVIINPRSKERLQVGGVIDDIKFTFPSKHTDPVIYITPLNPSRAILAVRTKDSTTSSMLKNVIAKHTSPGLTLAAPRLLDDILKERIGSWALTIELLALLMSYLAGLTVVSVAGVMGAWIVGAKEDFLTLGILGSSPKFLGRIVALRGFIPLASGAFTGAVLWWFLGPLALENLGASGQLTELVVYSGVGSISVASLMVGLISAACWWYAIKLAKW